ncbi:MAG: ribonucleoside-diphosphate reductase subunit alpha [Proteobacteria bacterium]|nr:MAG: ribonucleoside-diphosphate reductase subunit alpha [Pseudomonadota bacterium]
METNADILKRLKETGEAPEWLTVNGYTMLSSGYFVEGETPKSMWYRVAKAGAIAAKMPHLEEDFFQILWKNWLCLASPVAANLGTQRGLPISCYGVHPGDSTDSLKLKDRELALLSKHGGGVGIGMGDIRPINTLIGRGGRSSGIKRFVKMYESTTIGISQGSTRAGASAFWIPIEHGDFDYAIKCRLPEGDPYTQVRKMQHGVTISDKFMADMLNGNEENRRRYQEVMAMRQRTGQPYIMYTDNVNNKNPLGYKNNKLAVSFSNICTEITLFTDQRHSFICCLSSMNLARYNEWKDTNAVYLAVIFLDGVLNEFIDRAQKIKGFENVVRSARKGRALGLGVLGFHSLLQKEMTPVDSLRAKILNKAIFKKMLSDAQDASRYLAEKQGEPEWCRGTGMRNSHLLAIAPTASNSIISGELSPGIEFSAGNIVSERTAKGNFIRWNGVFRDFLRSVGRDTQDVWDIVVRDHGSCQNLDFMTAEQKKVFLTAYEIDQRVVIDLAADRQEYICQSQSVNLFIGLDSMSPQEITELHIEAWYRGIKTLYYVRPESTLKPDQASRGAECVACHA